MLNLLGIGDADAANRRRILLADELEIAEDGGVATALSGRWTGVLQSLEMWFCICDCVLMMGR